MAHTRHPLNNQVLTIFLPTIILAMLHHSEYQSWQLFPTMWYVIGFFCFGFTLSTIIHIRSYYILWITSLIQPPYNYLHFHLSATRPISPVTWPSSLATIPSPIPAILPIKAVSRAQWERESLEYRCFLDLSLLSWKMERDKCAHSH